LNGCGIVNYGCMGLDRRFDASEVIFYIDTSNATSDTLHLEINANAPIFVFYDQLDSDSLVTYDAKINPLHDCGGVCIENVIRGQIFWVVMDWPTAGQYQWSLSVNCTPMNTMGDTCKRPITSSVTGICTAGYRNDYNMLGGNCSQGPSHPGADLVYKLCLRPHGQIRVRMEDQCAFFSSFYLFTNCNDPAGSCVASVADLVPDVLPDPLQIDWANPADSSLTVYLAADNICPDIGSKRFPFGYRANLLTPIYQQCDPMGACCRADGVCLQRTMAECQALAGAYFLGVGVPCDPNPCPITGACCYPTGQCWLRPSQADCQQYGGFWLGAGTVCSPNPCVGACCVGLACTLRSMTDCQQMGGTFKGYGVSCAPNPCLGGVLGACCWPNGTCTMTGPPPQCQYAWMGPTSLCLPNPCPQPPTGACCVGSTCTINNAFDCGVLGGTYKGNGTTCTPTNPCDVTGIGPGPDQRGTRLLGAVPNPFNGTTSIRFVLARAGRVDLDLFDAGGRLVRHLSGFSAAGEGALAWDAREAGGQRTRPGVYYCRFTADGQQQSTPVILIQ
jgi:hypothetical protein